MRTFSLKIVTPDGIAFEGEAESVTVRTISGDLGILAGHTNLLAPLSKGNCSIVTNGKRCNGTFTGGMVSVMEGLVTLISSGFMWNE